jgi:hypothetical protein
MASGLIAEVLRVTTAEDEALHRQAMQAAGDDPRAHLLAICSPKSLRTRTFAAADTCQPIWP